MDERYNLKHYMALQMAELDEHKYFLSQREGYDLGMDYTIQDWILSGNATRFHNQYMASIDLCESLATKYEGREIPKNLVHFVLGDDDPTECDEHGY
jgi:hypothetical protein